MATLIPAIGSSAFDTTGERRLAERLEQQLDAAYLPRHNVPIGPKQTHRDFAVLQSVITGVDAGHIPAGQYHAILIDEGHDFAREWPKLVTQMVDPTTNSLLLLYDDAQSIYDRTQKKNFSLKSLDIQASGRTTILKIDYRSTRQFLQLAHRMASDMLKPADADGGNDGIPLLQPLSCGSEGPEPIVIDLPTLPERAAKVAELLADQHAQGHACGDMTVLCRHYKEIEECAAALARKKLPRRMRRRSISARKRTPSRRRRCMRARGWSGRW